MVSTGLVDCYIKANRLREAMTTFSNSYHVLGSTPRTLTALASVLAKDRMTLDKVQQQVVFHLKVCTMFQIVIFTGVL